MLGELISVRAVQRVIPRLSFNIRLKNNSKYFWRFFAYKGSIRLHETVYTIAEINGDFVDFSLEPQGECAFHVEVELDYRKLDFIEEMREGDLKLKCYLNLLGVRRGATASGFERFSEAIQRGFNILAVEIKSGNFDHINIYQSQWVKILKGLGYGDFKIVELQIPSVPSRVLKDAFASFDKAKQELNKGNYVEVLIKCQDVMDKIGKATKPIKSRLESLMGKEKFKRVGTFKGTFEGFLGLRHEVALDKEPIKRKDAQLAIQTTLAILNYFARRIVELKEKR